MGSAAAESDAQYDVLIVGAGLSGVCSLYNIRRRFPLLRVKVLEAGEAVGGTWHWNRYPGARFDSESVSYAFSFDKEILDQWHWKEAFSPQPETLKYIEFVCEKHRLYEDMQFNTRIASARWQDESRTWILHDADGKAYETRFFLSCLGFLSSPTLPAIPGIADFRGEAFHTSRWPRDLDSSRDFAGKRVGVIGTGATGIQTITALSKEPSIKSLHVFQRTANWSAPLRNSAISVEQMAAYRGDFAGIFRRCAETPGCFLHQPDPRRSLDVTAAERLALWEQLYQAPGFGKWLGTFSDTYTDREANAMYSEFIANKIRERVHDPAVAESLIPKNHGFGTRRVPLDRGYFEAYNKPNVHLVDLRKSGIRQFTQEGIETEDRSSYPLDVVIFATGFDAITGAFSAIDWRGKDGVPLLASTVTGSSSALSGATVPNPDPTTTTGTTTPTNQAQPIWTNHQPRTYLGLSIPQMPNLFMVLGPHQPFGNATRSIEHAVSVICELLQHCLDEDISYVEPTAAAADQWTEHVVECSKGALLNEVDSWMTGVNRNVSGKESRSVARYAGSAVEFRRRCEECRVSGWKGFVFV